MLKLWRFVLFFLVCLVIALGFNLPLQQVLPHVQLPQTIAVTGVDGTVLKGRAREITIDDFPLRDIDYRYLPSCLPLLKVCYRIVYERGDLKVAYDVLNGDTEVADTSINYPVGEIAHFLPPVPVRLAGRLELVIDEMSYYEGRPARVSGRLVWHDLGIDDDGIKINIGDYQVEFTGSPAKYDFDIGDRDGALEVDGEGEIQPDGSYALDLRIVTETGVDPNVRNVLGIVARSEGYNRYRIQQSGRLAPQITRQLFD